MKEDFRADTTQMDLTLGFSDIPTLAHLRIFTPISHSPHALAAISTYPQLSSPQQAL
jgi:hypothetical protein